MTIEYPEYTKLNSLTKEDFTILAYINSPAIRAALKGMGFNYRWMELDEIEEMILELIENCLKILKEDPDSKHAYSESGKIRVEVNVIDLKGDKVLRLEPRILLDIWSW